MLIGETRRRRCGSINYTKSRYFFQNKVWQSLLESDISSRGGYRQLNSRVRRMLLIESLSLFARLLLLVGH